MIHAFKEKILGTCLALVMGMSINTARASVSIIVDVGEITSGGSLVNGTFLIVSHGTNTSLDSTGWTSGTSFIRGDDSLFAAFSIVNGVAGASLNGYTLPSPGTGTKISGIFIAGLSASDIDYSSASLLNSKTFGTSGSDSYSYGTYRNDLPEKFGATSAGDNIGWSFPADGGTYNLSAYSGTGDYIGNDISANLATSSSFILVPEPSTGALMMIGAVGLVALRRLRKV